MACLSRYLRNKLVDHLLRQQTYTPPTSVWVGLFTTLPTDGVNEGVEVAAGDYARVEIPCGLAYWAGTQGLGTTAVSSGDFAVTSNNQYAQFSAPLSPWGTVIGVGLWDAATAGNLLLWGPLAVSKSPTTGDNPQVFPAGSLLIELDI